MSSNPNATLRKASEDDARAVADVWHLGWRDGHLAFVPQELVEARTEESFRDRAAERISEMTVAVVEGVIAGFVLVADDEVEQVYVAPRHRGAGIADLLMSEAERQVREKGYSKAWLAVVPGNARARSFYERRGWRDEGGFEYAAAAENGSIAVLCHRYTKDVQAM